MGKDARLNGERSSVRMEALSFFTGKRVIMTQLHEECGVFGAYAPEAADLAGLAYYGLFALQHRGQESCGTMEKRSCIFEYIYFARIVLIDDSIVRGTTSGQIVNLLREAGAREIHMRISSPPFRNPCYYGTDIDSRDNLIACHYSVEEIAKIIGADSLGYLELPDLTEMIGSRDYCHACFSGEYPTPIPTHTAKDRFEGKLSQRESKTQEASSK